MPRKNVFFVGLDDFNRQTLEQLPAAAECDFHAALTLEEMRGERSRPIAELIDVAAERMHNVEGGPHGVTSFFDFPGTILASILAERFGLPGPSLEAVMKCEHKYWSRLEQKKVAPDHVPAFQAFDPYAEDVVKNIRLIPPFWIKPIKSFRSYLAFSIADESQFAKAVEVCRESAGEIMDPFQEILEAFEFPREWREMKETFIAESPLSGAQCTLEAYAFDGRIVCYGVVDSIREASSSSFSRYEYPSRLPLEIQHRMFDVTRAVMQQIGFTHGAFNVEFFYDQNSDNVWLLEINPRPSQSHADLFQKVHGVSHFATLIDLALGRKPMPLPDKGQCNVAAHFFVRAHELGKVVQAPTSDAIARLQRRQPLTRVKLEVQRGDDLADLRNQDSYSYELASLYIGGRDRQDVLDKYDEAMTALQFVIEGEVVVA
ncbi:MAG: ATP-grasp domain-containing protein [Phycisphaeraceae bacterium]